jgi:hypothetical protein
LSDGALPGLELPLVSFISVHLIHQGFQEICSRRAASCQIRSENVTGSENLVEDVSYILVGRFLGKLSCFVEKQANL